MKINQLTVDEALQSLKSDLNGLTAPEVARRLLEFGPNRVEKVKSESMLLRFFRGFIHFFALILWVAAGLAFFADWKDPGKGMGVLGIAILGVIFVNGIFSFWQEYQAERAISSLQRLIPNQVKAYRDNKVQQVPASELVPGDLIVLDEGDGIPADCRIIQSFGVRVNNATVTGESAALFRDENPTKEEDLINSPNILLAGTSIVAGQTKALVFATGMHTEFGMIAHLTQVSPQTLSPMQKEVIFLSRIVAILATCLGVIFFIIGYAIGLSFWENFIFAIGIIVANVPEGLLPTVTLALAMGSQRMAKRSALIRNLPSVETLGSTTVICTDKTGTLTQNRMEIKKLFLSGRFYDLSDSQILNQLSENHRLFFEGALLCQDLRVIEKDGKKDLRGDPMETALVQMAKRAIPDAVDQSRLYEIPFDSDRKMLSILYNTPKGLVLYTKGALESLIPLCSQMQTEKGIENLSSEIKERIIQSQNSMAEEGLRVLAFAHKLVPGDYDQVRLEEGLIFSGMVGIADPPRPEALKAIEKCRDAGIKVIMLTGDHPRTAKAIGKEVGLVKSDNAVIFTGQQLRQLSDAQLQLVLDEQEIIFARLTADQKMRIVGILKRKKEIVAVTGDGVNDAPALKKADIGIAMGISGTEVAREASDMILMDDNFASIVNAIEEGRAVYDNIRKFLTYILTSNIPELVPYLAFVLFKIPLPLTVIQILAVDLGTDMLPALGLGIEKPGPEIMKNPPRPIKERLVNMPLLIRAYLFLGIMEAAAALSAFFFVLKGGGWQYGQILPNNDILYLQATTACLSAIIVMQIVNVFLCRSDKTSAFSFGLFSNKLILWGIITEIVLIVFIDYSRWGNLIFGTHQIDLSVWLFALPFALGMLVIEELRKYLARRKPALRRNINPIALKS